MKRIALAVALLASLAAPVRAGFDEGWAAYDRGDYETALREWRPLAEQGNAFAQYALGLMYAKGRGVPQGYDEAVKWYLLAAEQGDWDAQYRLGFMFAMGEGVSQDNAEAVKWFRRGAEQGDARAQYSLGVMYANGHGVPLDHVEAHLWFNLAAAQGDVRARDFRERVEANMSSAQIAEAQRRAREWKPQPQ